MKKKRLRGKLSLRKSKISSVNSLEILGGLAPLSNKCETTDCHPPDPDPGLSGILSMIAGIQCAL